MTRFVSWLGTAWPYLANDIKADGWRAFVAGHVAKERAWFEAGGVTPRWLLHNPGFTPLGRTMDFAQFLQPDKRLRELRAEFAKAWKPVTKRHEVICYLGKLDDVPREDRGWWFNRVEQSVRPALDAGMSLAFDVLSRVTADHPGHGLVRMLEGLGVRCYVEPFPHVWADGTYAHWYPTPKIGEADGPNGIRDANVPKFTAFGDADERICWLNRYSTEFARDPGEARTAKDIEIARLRRVLSWGPNYTAGLRVCGHGSVRGAADLGVTAGELVAAVRDAAGAK